MQEKKGEDPQQALNEVSEVGIDEVGRGAVFGPVFSAVVVLNEKNKVILKKSQNREKKRFKLKLKQMQIPKINLQIKLVKIVKLYLQIKRMKLNL